MRVSETKLIGFHRNNVSHLYVCGGGGDVGQWC